MSMTPKQNWIFAFMCLFCHHCTRRKRIFDRLQVEIKDDEFDHDKEKKADEIVKEET